MCHYILEFSIFKFLELHIITLLQNKHSLLTSSNTLYICLLLCLMQIWNTIRIDSYWSNDIQFKCCIKDHRPFDCRMFFFMAIKWILFLVIYLMDKIMDNNNNHWLKTLDAISTNLSKCNKVTNVLSQRCY